MKTPGKFVEFGGRNLDNLLSQGTAFFCLLKLLLGFMDQAITVVVIALEEQQWAIMAHP
jgi:hypothetical protein